MGGFAVAPRLPRLFAGLVVAMFMIFSSSALAADPTDYAGQSHAVLPPGQYGGVGQLNIPPPNANSFDQIPLYDGLTPKFDNVTEYGPGQPLSPVQVRHRR